MRYREVLIFFLVAAFASTLSIVTSEPVVYEAQLVTEGPSSAYVPRIDVEPITAQVREEQVELVEVVSDQNREAWQPKVELESVRGSDWSTKRFYFSLQYEKDNYTNWGVNSGDRRNRLIVNDTLELPISQVTTEQDGRYSFTLAQLGPERVRELEELDGFQARINITVNDNPKNLFRRSWSVITVASTLKSFET